MSSEVQKTIHVETCNEKGVFVAECEAALRNDAKAELIIGMIVSLDRKLTEQA
jgi:hypothetical protein